MFLATRKKSDRIATESAGTVDFEAVLDALPVNVLVLDPVTATVTYANRHSVQTLRGLQAFLPSTVRPDAMVGTSMDVFHKNPNHQRGIVSDPSRLPWRTKIRLGPKTLDLHVSAVHAASGAYVAAVLSWAEVTALADAITAFDTTIQGAFDQSARATQGMRGAVQTVRESTDETSTAAAGATSGAGSTSDNVQSVAAAVEEMTAANNEISRQMAETSQATQRAVVEAAQARTSVQALADISQKIGTVVSMISAIASQTNLLALNATIEAARAGAAGRGFAVVAAEVKELASQTTRATAEISQHIAGVQGATAGTVQAIDRIADAIGMVDHSAAAVAAASEQQGATVAEIGRNARSASDQTAVVGQNIGAVATCARRASDSAEDALAATARLEAQMEAITAAVGAFMIEVKKI
ncbi:methyl-accepting chemotaxis protein [Methylobacterium sp. NEAU 140]|uniref:methyl-accepting chemotaxis protein n=1 Tax=Methylobacterium sp. NEAU 140 TaxID=3064945 RepID=UPI00273581A6|nr:methyl-accepting chemotaxis protein [Methylobacterium sp. NEAU 140]MDP4021925.1 methyl-accepting chemotaxis protein [Methylobacterium sp. NEAU 140]